VVIDNVRRDIDVVGAARHMIQFVVWMSFTLILGEVGLKSIIIGYFKKLNQSFREAAIQVYKFLTVRPPSPSKLPAMLPTRRGAAVISLKQRSEKLTLMISNFSMA
jgi:hypothetical protein